MLLRLTCNLGKSLRVARPVGAAEVLTAIVIEDDEAATIAAPVSPDIAATILNISIDDATKLLGPNPLDVARQMNVSRAASSMASRSARTDLGALERFGRFLPMDRYSMDQVPA